MIVLITRESWWNSDMMDGMDEVDKECAVHFVHHVQCVTVSRRLFRACQLWAHITAGLA